MSISADGTPKHTSHSFKKTCVSAGSTNPTRRANDSAEASPPLPPFAQPPVLLPRFRCRSRCCSTVSSPWPSDALCRPDVAAVSAPAPMATVESAACCTSATYQPLRKPQWTCKQEKNGG